MRHVDTALIKNLLGKAEASDRRRAFELFHTPEEPFNRMLIAGLQGSYAAPHRHTMKLEVFTHVMGELTVLEFNNDGSIKNAYDLSRCPYVEVQPMTWHAVIFQSPQWAFMEMALWPKAYDPTDKEFAPWAPLEGSEQVPDYLERLSNEIRKNALS